MKDEIRGIIRAAKDIVEYSYTRIIDPPKMGMDATGMNTSSCPSCGSRAFNATIMWKGGDEPSNVPRIAGYRPKATCYKCNTIVSLPTPRRKANSY